MDYRIDSPTAYSHLQWQSDQQKFLTLPQFAISSWGGRRHMPFAFTEHGAIQAANVLRSTRAVEMGIYVVRAFVQLRELLASNKELAKRVDELEKRIMRKLDTHDQAITEIIKTIRQLMNPPKPKKRSIGFVELQHVGRTSVCAECLMQQ